MDETTRSLIQARKTFSRIGLALSVILVVATLVQVLWIMVPDLIWGEDNWLTASSWGMWLGTFLPLYLVAIPVGLLIMRKLPAEKPEDHKLGTKDFLVVWAISVFVMYAGNIIGNTLAASLSGGTAENALTNYAMDTSPLKILFMVILAPLLEEYVCRKQIIDRTRQYGEKTAVFLSAVTFGLLHMNLFQFFYAFGLGLVFAYIYTRTGRLRYPVLLHAIVNFMGSVIAPWILSLLDLEALDTLATLDPTAPEEELLAVYGQMLPGLIVYMLYLLFMIGMSVTGLVLLMKNSGKLVWKDAENQLPQGTAVKTAYWNLGMVLYVLLCLGMIVFSLM